VKSPKVLDRGWGDLLLEKMIAYVHVEPIDDDDYEFFVEAAAMEEQAAAEAAEAGVEVQEVMVQEVCLKFCCRCYGDGFTAFIGCWMRCVCMLLLVSVHDWLRAGARGTIRAQEVEEMEGGVESAEIQVEAEQAGAVVAQVGGVLEAAAAAVTEEAGDIVPSAAREAASVRETTREPTDDAAKPPAFPFPAYSMREALELLQAAAKGARAGSAAPATPRMDARKPRSFPAAGEDSDEETEEELRAMKRKGVWRLEGSVFWPRAIADDSRALWDTTEVFAEVCM
jgi:hypothetical protein